MTIHELLNHRFATKVFDATKKVSQEDVTYILEAARLSCSSGNTQPWKMIVVTNPELRTKLREVGYGQPQITEASHLIVLATMKDPMVHVTKTAELIAAGSSQESADKYLGMIKGWLRPTEEGNIAWLSRQTYLALQAMILAAVEKGIDSCPMEGFDAQKVNEILNLTDCVATTMLPIGYAAQPGLPKVRIALADLIEERA